MLNIVIPMAGLGSRFSSAGYSLPKFLIPVHQIPMVQLVIRNLRPECKHRFIFICQKTHVVTYDLKNKLKSWTPNSIVVELDGVTEGAACTVLMAKPYINNNDPLMIANSDQYIDCNINRYLLMMAQNQLDGLIMTMWADNPKWSFVKLNNQHLAVNIAEKEVISNEATVGIYNFRMGSDFVTAAELMIANELRVNNEFYVAPVYNQLIKQDRKVGVFNVGRDGNGMHGLGTPDDLNQFLKLPLSFSAAVIA